MNVESRAMLKTPVGNLSLQQQSTKQITNNDLSNKTWYTDPNPR